VARVGPNNKLANGAGSALASVKRLLGLPGALLSKAQGLGKGRPAKYRILFVCMGNICRSPMAEAVTRHMAEKEGLATRITVASAGTHAREHAGWAPDERARRVAARRGYDMSKIRARVVIPEDFDRFDRILAMDAANLSLLRGKCPEESRAKLGLFLRCADSLEVTEVPDPYYGDESGFERVLDLCELAASGLLKELARDLPPPSP
jgi:protein-tyrosine phosphatase